MILSYTQRTILHFIRTYIKENGYPPTVAEIADGVKLRSKSSVIHQLNTLERGGFIRRDANVARGLIILTEAELE
ncbi:hypothetical protein [Amycolatopsis sp. NPDC021455]|uniref:LexA family protein n=1 Tax=Amycolatopsis sp. NPDC021455 TaxID=3154901 RepID=UPI00340E92E9